MILGADFLGLAFPENPRFALHDGHISKELKKTFTALRPMSQENQGFAWPGCTSIFASS